MPSKYVHTEIDGQKIRLSNLDKLIYPDAGISKAEVIQYFLDIAVHYLRYSKNRPTTLIRFPDGINADSFYSKSAPDWTPEWIRTVNIQHSKELVPYVVPTHKAVLAWTANLSGLELHPTQMTYDQLENPDYLIFDLDPDATQGFEEIVVLAIKLKDFLKKYDYVSFVKTSGSKGIHVLIPIVATCSHDQLSTVAKKLAQEFIALNPDTCTLHLKKDKRQGKLLVDIFRNHKAQTTVAAYSLRAKPGAPISMPVSWKELKDLKSSQQFNISNYKDYLAKRIDPWKEWENSRVELHTLRSNSKLGFANITDDRLLAYAEKRNFKESSEPLPKVYTDNKHQFVIQLHDARNLHYDLRLESEGVLLSWAIPHGLPFNEDEKRLAIRTEDHPVKYLYFEGEIPKKEYGAGHMWIISSGNYEVLKQSKGSIKFKIIKGAHKGVYHIFQMKKDNQWLIERLDQFSKFNELIPKHMLANTSKEVVQSSHLSYEIKWDGIRVFIIKDEDSISIKSRSGRDITENFPEICLSAKAKIKANKAIIDGELVCLDDKGRPIFSKIISRMHSKGSNNISRISKSNPAVLYAFDLTNIDNIDLTSFTLSKRQAILSSIVKVSEAIRISEIFNAGQALLAAAKQMNLEGIMIKKKESNYAQGQRSNAWLKYKFRETETCYIIGYTEGKGDRKALFGSLHLINAETKSYRGRVGSGFDHNKMQELLGLMQAIITETKPIKQKLDEESKSSWIEIKILCEIQFASLTKNGTFREPIFLHLCED